LRAIVHQASVRYLWSDDLRERLRSERQQAAEAMRRRQQELREAYARAHPSSVVETFIAETLREANRPPDEEWEALA
jgi:hypothetical protein